MDRVGSAGSGRPGAPLPRAGRGPALAGRWAAPSHPQPPPSAATARAAACSVTSLEELVNIDVLVDVRRLHVLEDGAEEHRALEHLAGGGARWSGDTAAVTKFKC